MCTLSAGDRRGGAQDALLPQGPAQPSYIFTYHCGGELLDALFAARADRDASFSRLLTEPVTPGQIRAWIG